MAAANQYLYEEIPYPEGGTPSTGDLIELVFDKFSPRSHFIVRQTEGNVDKNTKANEIDETMLLVIKFLKNRPKYDQQAVRIIKFALRESLRKQYIIQYLDFEMQAL
ncbi:unnamed protein product [Adineta steineri]|uniref:Uncharacterized protein n=1 Tax=Adineta steineri TaxID=433720 RepID=A0A816EUC8_9BILA|nr:unnamed protein product [Adineta steineri]CAF1654372.1 unnamed protein product [Adineta steineri]